MKINNKIKIICNNETTKLTGVLGVILDQMLIILIL